MAPVRQAPPLPRFRRQRTLRAAAGSAAPGSLGMLCHLEIQDFAIVDALTVTFEAGFTTITGETGAGKSIMLDALGLVLGDRAQGRLVREGRPSAQLAAEFSVAAIPKARAWLDDQSLQDPDDPERCLLRRTLTEDGRSRAYINGRAVTLGELRALSELLIDIHAQHAHQPCCARPFSESSSIASGDTRPSPRPWRRHLKLVRRQLRSLSGSAAPRLSVRIDKRFCVTSWRSLTR